MTVGDAADRTRCFRDICSQTRANTQQRPMRVHVHDSIWVLSLSDVKSSWNKTLGFTSKQRMDIISWYKSLTIGPPSYERLTHLEDACYFHALKCEATVYAELWEWFSHTATNKVNADSFSPRWKCFSAKEELELESAKTWESIRSHHNSLFHQWLLQEKHLSIFEKFESSASAPLDPGNIPRLLVIMTL